MGVAAADIGNAVLSLVFAGAIWGKLFGKIGCVDFEAKIAYNKEEFTMDNYGR